MDITYIPMARGFVYLAAVMDWYSRSVPAWRVSITMETDFCIKARLARYFAFYNTRRPHSSLDRLTLDQFYFNSLPQPEAA